MTTELKPLGPKEVGDEPLPGYRLLEPLGKGGFGEVWKCEVPGGLLKAIKFVKGSNTAEVTPPSKRDSAALELQAIQHIKTIRHPFLLSIDRVEVVKGEMVIVMELADRNLAERFAECQAAGPARHRPRRIARLLAGGGRSARRDESSSTACNTSISSRANLFLVGNHLKVADFGLVNSLEELQASGSPEQLDGLTPLLRRAGNAAGQDEPAQRPVQPGHRLSGIADRDVSVSRRRSPQAA